MAPYRSYGCLGPETHLTASAGVSINKFLSKMASGLNKLDGLSLIAPHQAEEIVQQLPIERFHGRNWQSHRDQDASTGD